MTNDHHACVDHQQEFFRNRLFHFTKHNSPRDQILLNSKTSHAKQLYNRWKEGTEKQIFSRRHGIEYSMKYLSASNKNVIRYHHRNMYIKRLFNFKFIPSPNPKTKKKQQKRFDQNCNRVFNTHYDSACIGFDAKLKAARKNHFIFHKSQTIHKTLSHLTYSRKSVIPDASVYPFNIPFYEPIDRPPVRLSGGLLKYRKTKFCSAVRMGFQSIETPKIHSAIPVGFRSMEKPSFISSAIRMGFRSIETPKIHSAVRVDFRSMEKPSFDQIFRRTGKFQDSFGKTKKPRFVRSGGLPKNENPKICLGGLLKNENPKIKIRKCGRLPINKNSKIKIRFSFGWIGFDFGLWAFDSIGCDILGLWICIGCDISLAGFGSVSTLNFY
ncbi:unnamed protein product [Rhizophagus irregularis]|nr:unnamed protein product [Rhizophagus irregularis]